MMNMLLISSVIIFIPIIIYIYTPAIYNKNKKNKNEIELTILSKHCFTPNNDYFVYEHLTDEKLALYIDIIKKEYNDILLILRKDNENINNFYYYYGSDIKITFEERGKYYLDFIYINIGVYLSNMCFISFSLNKNPIDLSEDYYFGYFNEYLHKPEYHIYNLTEDKQVYFTYGNILNDYPRRYNINSPFIICDNNWNCIDNVYSYKFMKGKKYYIEINYIDEGPWTYYFFPIFENTIQNISDVGYFNIDSPKIFVIEENKEFYFDAFNIQPYFLPVEDINKGSNLPHINYSIFREIKTFSFYLEKDSKYRTIIFVPEINDKLKQIFITNKRCENADLIEITAGQNCLLEIYHNLNSLDNYFETFISPINNMRFASFEKKLNNDYSNYLFNHLGGKYLYIDKTENDIIIKKDIFEPKYLFFSIINDNTIEYFKYFLYSKKFIQIVD